jgi:1,4-dihydroxy-2-naphthoate octaprenyltransferase
VGALSTAILVVNNLRDLDTDARAGKRTLAVRIGRAATALEYSLLLGAGVAAPLIGIAAYGWPAAAAVASGVAALACVRPLVTVWRHRRPHDLLPALGQTARAVALYGIALTTALAWGLRPLP